MPLPPKHRMDTPRGTSSNVGTKPLAKHRGAKPIPSGSRMVNAGAASRSTQKRFLPAAKTPPTVAPKPEVPPRLASVEEGSARPFPRGKAKPEALPAPAGVSVPRKNPVHILSTEARNALFGRFSFTPQPTDGNPERIRVDPTWITENIVTVKIPASVLGLPANGVSFHKLIAPHFEVLIRAWDEANLLPLLLSWNGSYVARFRRGRAADGLLSAHSWGTAFDINARWNGFRKEPAPLGSEGSVVALSPIAKKLGWIWGGDFSSPDGMHFEAGQELLSKMSET